MNNQVALDYSSVCDICCDFCQTLELFNFEFKKLIASDELHEAWACGKY